MGWDVTITAPDGSKEYADNGRDHGRVFDRRFALSSEDGESREIKADLLIALLSIVLTEGLHDSGNPWLGDIKLLRFVLDWLTNNHEAARPMPVFTVTVSS